MSRTQGRERDAPERIDDGRAILDGVDEDVENRRKLVEEYVEMKADMRRYAIGPESPGKIQACLQRLKDANDNAEEGACRVWDVIVIMSMYNQYSYTINRHRKMRSVVTPIKEKLWPQTWRNR